MPYSSVGTLRDGLMAEAVVKGVVSDQEREDKKAR
jgi:hypothetical protein